MYQYKYVTVAFIRGFGKNHMEEHRSIIDAHARSGWRFVTAIPTKVIGYGALSEVDLVFERESATL